MGASVGPDVPDGQLLAYAGITDSTARATQGPGTTEERALSPFA